MKETLIVVVLAIMLPPRGVTLLLETEMSCRDYIKNGAFRTRLTEKMLFSVRSVKDLAKGMRIELPSVRDVLIYHRRPTGPAPQLTSHW